jgi:Domain of unknown function (DUF4386)
MISTTALAPGARADQTSSMRAAGLTAGIGLLILTVLSVFGYIVAVKGLVTPGDAAQTAADISASDGLFRLGIVSLYLVIVLDIVVGWALYRVFSPVSKSISILAAVMRITYSGVFLVAISELVAVPRLLGNDKYLAVFSPDQLEAQAFAAISAFSDVWHAGMLLFGVHLLLLGYLAFKSDYVPKVLAVLLAIDGLSYVIDTFGTVLSRGTWTDTATFTFIGEFLLVPWLIIRSRRQTINESTGRGKLHDATAAHHSPVSR